MSKSFSMRLSDFTITRPIGLEERLLNRTVDVYDVYSILSDEGFSNFEEERTIYKFHGRDLSSLRSRIATQLVGVPRHAAVCIDRYGPDNDFLLIKLEY